MKTTTEQMDASQVFCPNLDCMARGKIGEGNVVNHGKARRRYRCKTCGKTFSAQAGTMFVGIAQTEGLDCDRGDAPGVWLSNPGDCAGLWPGRTHCGKPGEIEQESTANRSIRPWCNKGTWIWC